MVRDIHDKRNRSGAIVDLGQIYNCHRLEKNIPRNELQKLRSNIPHNMPCHLFREKRPPQTAFRNQVLHKQNVPDARFDPTLKRIYQELLHHMQRI